MPDHWWEVRNKIRLGQRPLIYHLALFLQCTLASGNSLLLTFDTGFFIMLALANLRKYPRLFALFLELFQSEIKWFVFSNSYSWHP